MIAPLPQATSDPTTPAPTDSSSNDQLTGNDFITLLVSQLKNQDPTQPMDPTAFVTQLVQFNSLEQLININQDLTPPTSTPSTGPTGSIAAGNPTATQL